MLTNTAYKNAKPNEKPYKLADSSGLYFLVTAISLSLAHIQKFKYYPPAQHLIATDNTTEKILPTVGEPGIRNSLIFLVLKLT